MFSWDDFIADFPWTSFSDINVSWFLNKFHQIFTEWQGLYSTMQNWKTATDEYNATWRQEQETAFQNWENNFQSAIDAWKAQTETDINTWEQNTIANLESWKNVFITEYNTLKAEVEQISLDAENAKNSAQASATSAQQSADSASATAKSLSNSLAQIDTNTNDISDLKTQINTLKFDDFVLINDSYIKWENGGVGINYPTTKATDFIELPPNSYISLSGYYPTGTVSNLIGIAFYDANKSYLAGISFNERGGNTIKTVIPQTAKYIRFTVYNVVSDEIVFCYYVDAETINNAIDNANEFKEINDKNTVTITPTWEDGKYINKNGSIVDLSGFQISDNITIYAGQKLIVTGAGYSTIVAIISEKNLIDGTYIPLVLSTDNDVHEYVYEASDNKTLIVSVQTAKTHNIKLLSQIKEEIDYIHSDVAELKDIKNKIIPIPLGTLTQYSYIDPNTGANGSISNPDYYSSDFIPCYGIKSIFTNQYYSGGEGIAFYDKYKQFITGYSKQPNTNMGDIVELTVPNKAVYFRTSSRLQKTRISLLNVAETVSNIGDILLNGYPFYNLLRDGGLTAIFHTIGCIGDSLSSGETIANDTGTNVFHDMYEYSWGQCLARMCGVTAYNYSRGGQSAKSWMEEWPNKAIFVDNPCTLYLIWMGHNDSNPKSSAYTELGSPEDIDFTDYTQNALTFYGQYAAIIQRVKEISSKAKIFVMTMENLTDTDRLQYNDAIKYMATVFNDVFVMDLAEYGNSYFAKIRKDSNLWKQGHGTAVSYKMIADFVCTYIDWYIKNHSDKFINVQFIDSEWNLT